MGTGTNDDRNPKAVFRQDSAKRIAKVTQTRERMPLHPGVTARKYPKGSSFGGQWAQITSYPTSASDPNAGKYSFTFINFRADGTVASVSEVIDGDRTKESGFAREASNSYSVPFGALVYLVPAYTQQGEKDFYLFSYDLVLFARTKVFRSYPNAAAVFYSMEQQVLSGSQVEGGPATITSQGDSFYALNLGSVVPPQGTPVVVSRVSVSAGNPPGGTPVIPSCYWAFKYDG